MSTKTMKVGYRLVRNATSTADKAPYLGIAVPVGSLAYGNILQRMLDRGTFMTRATAQYFLNEFYEYAAKVIADDVVRINMGAVSIYPMIGGSFDSEDDAYREPRNRLYIGATLSQEIRDAVSGVTPSSLGAGSESGTVKISSVMDLASETYRLIDGLKEFRIAGIDLTVPDGEDESLELVAADGMTKAADITVVSTEDGQRIVCTLASAVTEGTYYVRLVSHGLDPTAPLVTALHKVTVKAGAAPVVPAPTIDSAGTQGFEPGVIEAPGGVVEVSGSNLETATAIDLLVGEDGTPVEDMELWQSISATYDEDGGVLTTNDEVEGSAPQTYGAVRVTTAGGSASYPVQYSVH